MNDAQLRELLDDALTCPRLSTWEESFLGSIRDRRIPAADLSMKQLDVLGNIEKQVYRI